MALPRNRSLKSTVFFLFAALLIAEYALIEHATEHGFHDQDEVVCFACEKADNFQNTLFVAIIPESQMRFRSYGPELHFESRLSPFQSLFLARAPPVSARI